MTEVEIRIDIGQRGVREPDVVPVRDEVNAVVGEAKAGGRAALKPVLFFPDKWRLVGVVIRLEGHHAYEGLQVVGGHRVLLRVQHGTPVEIGEEDAPIGLTSGRQRALLARVLRVCVDQAVIIADGHIGNMRTVREIPHADGFFRQSGLSVNIIRLFRVRRRVRQGRKGEPENPQHETQTQQDALQNPLSGKQECFLLVFHNASFA